jgi:hypothetical protein
VHLSDEVLEDNIERGELRQTILEMIAEAAGRDMEEVIINGDKIEFDWTLQIVGHAIATCQVQVLFAGITIFDSGANNYAVNATVRIRGVIARATSTTCRATVDFNAAGSATILGYNMITYTPATTLTGLTLTGTNILLVKAAATGTNSAASDVTCVQGSVDIIPAA